MNNLNLHITLSLLVVSILVIAALQALLLAYQDYSLRSRGTTVFIKCMPPLQTMETWLFQLLGFGFVLLSILVLTSVILSPPIKTLVSLQHAITAILAWIVFAILLSGRYFFGWRGQKAIRWTLSGVLLLVLSYPTSSFLLKLLL